LIHSIITADYDYDTNDINLYCRNEEGKRTTIKVIGFEPYFYVYDENGEYTGTDNQPLKKITTRRPYEVKSLREEYEKHYEADIPFPLRLLIDSNVKYGFDLPKDRTMAHWTKIKPVESDQLPRCVFCDIETYSKGRRFPLPTDHDAKVTINCMYDSTILQANACCKRSQKSSFFFFH